MGVGGLTPSHVLDAVQSMVARRVTLNWVCNFSGLGQLVREERGWGGSGSRGGGETVTPFQKVLTSLSLCVPSRSGRKVLP